VFRGCAACTGGQWGQSELILQVVDGRQVGLAVDLDPADDGEHAGWGRHDCHAIGNRPVVVAVGEQEGGFGGAGGPAADVSEVVGPGIHELEHVVAVVGVGHVEHDWALADVALPDQIEGVVVGRDELGLGSDQGAGSGERVVGRMDRDRLVLRRYEVRDLLQVVDQRIAIDVDLSGLLDLLSVSHDHAPLLGLRLDAL
jgi:hypothetical protein